MTTDDHRLRRRDKKGDPVVAGRDGADAQPELRDLAAKPVARLAPHRTPREPLRPVWRRSARSQLAKIVDDALRIHGEDSTRGAHIGGRIAGGHYRLRRTIAGSTALARRAGRSAAADATSAIAAATKTRSRGSRSATPISQPRSRRQATSAAANPMPPPAAVSRRPSASTSRRTRAASAPSARRMPISRTRDDTEYDSMP